MSSYTKICTAPHNGGHATHRNSKFIPAYAYKRIFPKDVEDVTSRTVDAFSTAREAAGACRRAGYKGLCSKAEIERLYTGDYQHITGHSGAHFWSGYNININQNSMQSGVTTLTAAQCKARCTNDVACNGVTVVTQSAGDTVKCSFHADVSADAIFFGSPEGSNSSCYLANTRVDVLTNTPTSPCGSGFVADGSQGMWGPAGDAANCHTQNGDTWHDEATIPTTLRKGAAHCCWPASDEGATTMSQKNTIITDSKGEIVFLGTQHDQAHPAYDVRVGQNRQRRSLPHPNCQGEDPPVCRTYNASQCRTMQGATQVLVTDANVSVATMHAVCPAMCGACQLPAATEPAPVRVDAAEGHAISRTRRTMADWTGHETLFRADAGWPLLVHTVPQLQLNAGQLIVYNPLQKMFYYSNPDACDEKPESTGNLFYVCNPQNAKGLWWNSQHGRIEGFVMLSADDALTSRLQLVTYGNNGAHPVSPKILEITLGDDTVYWQSCTHGSDIHWTQTNSASQGHFDTIYCMYKRAKFLAVLKITEGTDLRTMATPEVIEWSQNGNDNFTANRQQYMYRLVSMDSSGTSDDTSTRLMLMQRDKKDCDTSNNCVTQFKVLTRQGDGKYGGMTPAGQDEKGRLLPIMADSRSSEDGYAVLVSGLSLFATAAEYVMGVAATPNEKTMAQRTQSEATYRDYNRPDYGCDWNQTLDDPVPLWKSGSECRWGSSSHWHNFVTGPREFPSTPFQLDEFVAPASHLLPRFGAPAQPPGTVPATMLAFAKGGRSVQVDWLITADRRIHSYVRAVDSSKGTPQGSTTTPPGYEEGQILVDCCQTVFWNTFTDTVEAVDFTGRLLALPGMFRHLDASGRARKRRTERLFATQYAASPGLEHIARRIISCLYEDADTLLCVHDNDGTDATEPTLLQSLPGYLGDDEEPKPYTVSRFDVQSGETISTLALQDVPTQFGKVVGAGLSGKTGQELLLFTALGATVVVEATTSHFTGLLIQPNTAITATRAVYAPRPSDNCVMKKDGNGPACRDVGIVYYLVQDSGETEQEWRPYKVASRLGYLDTTTLPLAAKEYLPYMFVGEGHRGVNDHPDQITHKFSFSSIISNNQAPVSYQLKFGVQMVPALAVDGTPAPFDGAPYYDLQTDSLGLVPHHFSMQSSIDSQPVERTCMVYGDAGDGNWKYLGHNGVNDQRHITGKGYLAFLHWVKRLRFVFNASDDDLSKKLEVVITVQTRAVVEAQRVSFRTNFDKQFLRVSPQTMHLSSSASLALSPQIISAPEDDVMTGTYVETVKHFKFGATGGPVRTQFVGFQAVTRFDNENMDVYIDTPINTAVIEGGTRKEYSMRLSKEPVADLKIKVLVERTPMWDKDRGDSSKHIQQLAIVDTETGTTELGQLELTFTPKNWWIPQQVAYVAKNDTKGEQYLKNNKADGSKVQSFPRSAPRASRLAGPIVVQGFEDGSVDTAIPDPLMLAHEHEEGVFLSNMEVLRELQDVDETKSVDVLVLYDTASATGEMAQTTRMDMAGKNVVNMMQGLRMGRNTNIGGQFVHGGVTYGNIEETRVLLGHSGYTVDVKGTNEKPTAYHMGAGNDIINIHNTTGPVFIYANGGDDRLKVVPESGDFNRLSGLVAFDGADGLDSVSLDNRYSTSPAPGGKQVGVLGHDHVSGFGWNPSGDGTYSINLCNFTFEKPKNAGRYGLMIEHKGSEYFWSLNTDMEEDEITRTLQKTLFPFQNCGSKKRSVCATSVKARYVGCTLILEFRGEMSGDNTFAVTPLRDAAAFSIYNSIYEPHAIDLNLNANIGEWYTNWTTCNNLYGSVGMPGLDCDDLKNAVVKNPTPTSLQLWGQPDVNPEEKITCTEDNDCTVDQQSMYNSRATGKCVVGKCQPWGTIILMPQASTLRRAFAPCYGVARQPQSEACTLTRKRMSR